MDLQFFVFYFYNCVSSVEDATLSEPPTPMQWSAFADAYFADSSVSERHDVTQTLLKQTLHRQEFTDIFFTLFCDTTFNTVNFMLI